ncbi:hypothetical protein PI125_g15572 [Phytophthora idaei]|nr:hypothetical protein PI125_g15572 [Phytophthora idaei]
MTTSASCPQDPWVLVLASEAVGKVDGVAARLTEIGSAAKAVKWQKS